MKKKTIIITILMLLLFTTSISAQQPGKILKQNNQLLYTIKQGDTFYQLSRKFKTSVEGLQKLNPNQNPYQLQIGDRIKIKVSSDLKSYTVQPGDTLWQISRKNSIPLNLLTKFNPSSNPDFITPGEIILVPTKVKSKLYFIQFTQQDAHLVTEKKEISLQNNVYKNTLQELINGPTSTPNAQMPILKDTKVLGVTINNGIAHINFDEKILQANVGSASEHLLLLALANTLTEFKKIKAIKILVNGQQVETIGGHVVLNKPIYRSLNLVK
ncbi:LysM peptidoglycan-binding domain-containing protein [Halanaerobaculum tunisiense]